MPLFYRGGAPKMENFVFIITPFKLKILDQNIKYHLMSLALPFVWAKNIFNLSRFWSLVEQNVITGRFLVSRHFINKRSNFFGFPEHALDAYYFAWKRKFLTVHIFERIDLKEYIPQKLHYSKEVTSGVEVSERLQDHQSQVAFLVSWWMGTRSKNLCNERYGYQ